MIKKDKFKIDIIKPTSFYSNETEKTKLNWFLYELSLGIYDDVQKNLGKKLKKYRIYDEALAKFSVYFSKSMKDVILQKLSGKIDAVYFSYKMIDSYFPNLSDRVANKMLDIISKAWDEQLGWCVGCPTRCISEKDSYCTIFDEVPY